MQKFANEQTLTVMKSGGCKQKGVEMLQFYMRSKSQASWQQFSRATYRHLEDLHNPSQCMEQREQPLHAIKLENNHKETAESLIN